MEDQNFVRLPALEAQLLAHIDISDCVAIRRHSSEGLVRTVVYLVLTDHKADEVLTRRIAAEMLSSEYPVTVVQVDFIPRTLQGQPDLEALCSLPTVTPPMLSDYERRLTDEFSEGNWQVNMVRRSLAPSRVHVSDVLPREFFPERGSAAGAPAVARQQVDESLESPVQNAALCSGGELCPAEGDPVTLIQAIQRAVTHYPTKGLYIVADGEQQSETGLSRTAAASLPALVAGREQDYYIDYPALFDRACHVLGGIRKHGIKAGDYAILQVSSLKDYFPALWACILGGILPITIATPPSYTAQNVVLDKLYHAWQWLDSPVIISSGEAVGLLDQVKSLYHMETARVLAVEDCIQAAAASDLHKAHPGDVALLQLSSGSTGKSKIIQITHRGIVEYAIGARERNKVNSSDITFNWLPLDHVGGLVMFHLREVFLGATGVHAPTEFIIKNPLLWLDLMERYGVNHTWSPNFGYKLVTDALWRQPGRSWDLSTLRTLMNAGEQCTLPVISDFLRETARFGITPEKMLLAWGMAETCTAITYKYFADSYSIHYVHKSSLGSNLQWVDDSTDAQNRVTFLSVGRAAPGATMRIVDERQRVLPEGRIGHLQVQSGRVTPGYLNNPTANESAFVGGGWFDTGDLAYMRNGEIVITGREKETIIINGNNFFCYEIEDALGHIDGIMPTLVAACGVVSAETGSETLVIFFVPGTEEDQSLLETIQQIRATLAARFQQVPSFVIPMPQTEFPKTTSGKIQRTTLTQRLAEGDFAAIVKSLDLMEGNAQTLPDCVFQTRWEAREFPLEERRVFEGTTLIFSDEEGLGQQICQQERCFQSVVQVHQAESFQELGNDHYCLDPLAMDQWETLFKSLHERGSVPKTLLYLWSYTSIPARDGENQRTGAAISLCGEALVQLSQAFARHFGTLPCQIITVSRQLYRITGDEAVCYPAALTAAFDACLQREWPHVIVRHFDLPGHALHEDAYALLTSIQLNIRSVELAWRDGRLWTPVLEPVAWSRSGEDASLFEAGAHYLVCGGLGGIGAELLLDLLQRYQLKLLIVGRTALDKERTDRALEMQELLTHLRAYGDVSYHCVDICDGEHLSEIVAKAEQRWDHQLDGIIHLAGSYDFRPIIEENLAHWREALSSKVSGSLNLVDLLLRRPDARFIAFSSALSLLGAAGATAYCSANRFLQMLCTHLTVHTAIHPYCLSWTLWHGIGLNRHNSLEELVSKRGLLKLHPYEGKKLMQAVLCREPGHYLIGFDVEADEVRTRVYTARPHQINQLHVACTPLKIGARLPKELPPLYDDFGQLVPCTYSRNPPHGLPRSVEQTQPGEKTRQSSLDTAVTHRNRLRIRQQLLTCFQEVLRRDIDERRPFNELGLGSLHLLQIHARLQQALGDNLPVTLLFQYPTIEALATFLAHDQGPTPASEVADRRERGGGADRRIAIIGMAARFPGAETLEDFWANLCEGVESVQRFSREELEAAGITAEVYEEPDFVPVSGGLRNVEMFDAEFFGISPREAAFIEPQQRLFLECCYHALESGGYVTQGEDVRIGIFAGVGMNLYSQHTYLQNNLRSYSEKDNPIIALQVAIGNQPDFAATRVAYKLGLTGPALSVQTACSTSLVAVHLACQAILQEDADLALAGAAAVHVPVVTGYSYCEDSILSQSGHCRAFDAEADGTVGGNGVGVVLLKRLDRAIADGDTIHAVILGSAINNDGTTKVGFTAPSVDGQARVIERALEIAGVPAESISYIETHGTGTQLGDPIEFQALNRVFKAHTGRRKFCALGTVKPNIGHLDSCAGMAGLLKAVLALKHRQLPPMINFSRPNPHLELEHSPFYMNTELRAWETNNGGTRRAGVSAFGVGGTNAHLILEEAPPQTTESVPKDSPSLLLLSTHNRNALTKMAQKFVQHLRQHPAIRPSDLFVTTALGRRHLGHRLVVSGNTTTALAEGIEAFCSAPDGPLSPSATFLLGTNLRSGGCGPVTLLFTGQGTRCDGCTPHLFQRFSIFRQKLEECEQYYRSIWNDSLLELLLGTTNVQSDTWSTDRIQPALFAFEVALAQLWRSLGIRPGYVLGHSLGEYAAFCVAGALSLEDGLYLTAIRGRLMESYCQPGRMLTAFADRATIDALLTEVDGLELAVVNTQRNYVLAGLESAVTSASQWLAEHDISCRLLPTTQAFHSTHIEPILEQFRAHLEQVRFQPLTIPLISSVDGQVLPVGTTPDAEYFCRQTRQVVRFDLALARLAEGQGRCCLEVGPDAVLSQLGRNALTDFVWISSQKRTGDPVENYLRAVGELYCQGANVDWRILTADIDGRRIRLPLYPFQGQPYWIGDRPVVLESAKQP